MNKLERLQEATMLALQGKLTEDNSVTVSAMVYLNPRFTIDLNREEKKIFMDIKNKYNLNPRDFKTKLIKLAISRGFKYEDIEKLASYKNSDDIVDVLDLINSGLDSAEAFNKVDQQIEDNTKAAEEKANNEREEFIKSMPDDIKSIYNNYMNSDKFNKDQKYEFEQLLKKYKLHDAKILNKIIDANLDADKIDITGYAYKEGTYNNLEDYIFNKNLLDVQYYCLSKAIQKNATDEDIKRIASSEFTKDQLWKLFDRLDRIKHQTVTDTINKL